MRRPLRILRVVLLYAFSIDLIIALVDYFALWQSLSQFLQSNKLAGMAVRNPLVWAFLLIVILLVPKLEGSIKDSDIVAIYTNRLVCHDLLTTSWGAGMDQMNKTPGWDMRPLNWHIFVEVQLANDSETPGTLEDAEIKVMSGPRFWFKKHHAATHVKDLSKCWKRPGRVPLTALMDATRNVPLTKGIGHRGWLRFHLNDCSIRDGQTLRYEITLIDALQGRHLVGKKPGSEQHFEQIENIFVDP